MEICRKLVILIIVLVTYGLAYEKQQGIIRKYSNSLPRIVGGTKARLGEFPFLGLIRFSYDDSIFCGCSIIGSKWFLTAAHCVADIYYLEYIIVSVGSIEYNDLGDIYDIEWILVHPKYHEYYIWNDIAIMKTTLEIQYNSLVQPIKLASYNIDADESVIAIGMGNTDVDIESYEVRSVRLTTTTTEHCDNVLSMIDGHAQLCTKQPAGKGACMGDSGGPLINRQRELHGIVSFGNPCALGDPDVYVRVYNYKSWISEVTDYEI